MTKPVIAVTITDQAEVLGGKHTGQRGIDADEEYEFGALSHQGHGATTQGARSQVSVEVFRAEEIPGRRWQRQVLSFIGRHTLRSSMGLSGDPRVRFIG